MRRHPSRLLVPALTGLSLSLMLGSGFNGVAARAVAGGVADQARFRSAIDVVALNVSVTHSGSPISDLAEQDFEVYEDGVAQPIRYFSADPAPLDLILLLDASSSMRDEMPAIHGAARKFMAVLRPQDRGAVVTFTKGVSIVQELTSDTIAIERAIDSTTARGSTAFLRALYVILKQFGPASADVDEIRRRAIVVLSDGADTSSLVTLDDVLAVARAVGVAIYPIRLESSGTQRLDQLSAEGRAMTALATETGGRAFFPLSVYELRRAYTDIADDLRNQYSIGYPRNRGSAGGTVRRIRVHVPNHPEYDVRARKSYVIE